MRELRAASWAIALGSLAGCAGGGPSPGCLVGPGPSGSDRPTLVFDLSEAVEPARAPVPASASEAIVFRLAYETLVELDCEGDPRPAAAESWRVSDNGRTWTFRLRPGLDADSVRAAWQRTRRLLRQTGPLGWPWSRVPLSGVRAVDPRTLEVTTPRQEALHVLLSSPEFALAWDPPAGAAWPRGTRGSLEDRADFIAWTAPGAHAVHFRVQPGADPRDLAHSRAHAFLAGQHGAAVAALPGWTTAELPTGRVHWLFTGSAPLFFGTLRNRDGLVAAVRGPARASTGGGWIQREGSWARVPTEILHDEQSADGRALAARLVALGTVPGLVTRGVPLAELLRRLREGEGGAFVVTLPPELPGAASEGRLADLAPWFESRGAVLPLVEAGQTLALRSGVSGIRVGADGVPRLDLAAGPAELP